MTPQTKPTLSLAAVLAASALVFALGLILTQRAVAVNATVPSACPLVTDAGDSGPGTLRDCLEMAGSGDTITFDPAVFPPGSPVTITLTSGPLPAISQGSLTLDASSAGVILDGSALATGHGLHITSTGNVVQGMQIVRFPGDGVRLDGGASQNLIGGDAESERNVIAANGGSGVFVSGTGSLYNAITRNSIYGNGGPGIDLFDGGNGELSAPTIEAYHLALGTASGVACAGCTVELFSDQEDEGRWFEGSTTAGGSGAWTFSKGSAFQGPRVTATATDTEGNTSEFGQGPVRVYLPQIVRGWPPIPAAPALNPIENPDGDGEYAVTWNSVTGADGYLLQEDDDASFSSPVTQYSGPMTSWSALERPEGLYYYRVRANNTWGDSAWSNVESVLVSAGACTPDPPGESSNIDDAIKVCPGQRVTGVVDGSDWDDVFKIECEKDQHLRLTLTGSNPDADLYVFAPEATDVNIDDWVKASQGLGSDEYIDYKIPYDGVWYIDVYAYEGSISYQLDIDLAR